MFLPHAIHSSKFHSDVELDMCACIFGARCPGARMVGVKQRERWQSQDGFELEEDLGEEGWLNKFNEGQDNSPMG